MSGRSSHEPVPGHSGAMQFPWTNVYGVARSLMASGLLLTLLFNSVDVLFQPAAFKVLHSGSPIARASLFYLFSGSREALELGRWIAIGLLALVASGWRPRFTGVLHWWLCLSFAVSTTVAEGGDQINGILSLLLIPVTLTDPRRWHWTSWTPSAMGLMPQLRAVVASSCLTMIRIQVAVIYFHAGISKLTVPEWVNGTAIYYWLTHQTYGMNEMVQSPAMWVLSNPLAVTLVTWGVIFVEITLASALVMRKEHYSRLLFLGLAFHFGIVVAHGLFSFFLAMAAALTIYLRPADQPFALRGLVRGPTRVLEVSPAPTRSSAA